MIRITHKNKEIEKLITSGFSSVYKHLSKKGFLKALHAFLMILKVVNETKELLRFNFLDYKHTEQSSVQIVGSGISKRLFFIEDDNWQNITILDFK